MFKFELDQLVYYINENTLCSAPILSRMKIENLHDNLIEEEIKLFKPFGNSAVLYATCHGIFSEDKLFKSKEDLSKFLFK